MVKSVADITTISPGFFFIKYIYTCRNYSHTCRNYSYTTRRCMTLCSICGGPFLSIQQWGNISTKFLIKLYTFGNHESVKFLPTLYPKIIKYVYCLNLCSYALLQCYWYKKVYAISSFSYFYIIFVQITLYICSTKQ